MKMTDIRVGEEYAYRRSSYETPIRVRVTETRAEWPEYEVIGYTRSGRRTTPGVRVEKVDPEDRSQYLPPIVMARAIESTWAVWDEKARELEAEKSRKDEQRRDLAERRARLLTVIEGNYAPAVMPLRWSPVYYPTESRALTEVGLRHAPDGRFGHRLPVQSLHDLVTKGKVTMRLADLAALLGIDYTEDVPS